MRLHYRCFLSIGSMVWCDGTAYMLAQSVPTNQSITARRCNERRNTIGCRHTRVNVGAQWTSSSTFRPTSGYVRATIAPNTNAGILCARFACAADKSNWSCVVRRRIYNDYSNTPIVRSLRALSSSEPSLPFPSTRICGCKYPG
jgi:hypothetical protein